MVKFENQVALNKITRFVETTPLVIFLHCRHRDYFQKKLNRLLSLNDYIGNKESSKPTLEDFTIRLVKNNYVKKALLRKLSLNNSSSSLKDSKEDTFIPHDLIFSDTVQKSSNNFVNRDLPKAKKTNKDGDIKGDTFSHELRNDKVLLKEVQGTPKAKVAPLVKNKQFENENALFQGNRLIFTLKKISLLSVIKDLVEEENMHILGGVYENRVIDHNQIKRLIDNSENNFLYLRLNNKLKENLLLLTYRINLQYKIIALLKQKALKSVSLT